MKPNTTTQTTTQHYVRTVIASIFGALTLWLIVASVVVVWLNHTLTDTPTFVKTVTPLVSQPAVQSFFTEKISDQITQKNNIEDVASVLLPAGSVVGVAPQQLKIQVQSVVDSSLKQVLRSPEFKKLWEDTNRSAHEQLLTQLQLDSTQVQLDLSPALTGATQQLRSTNLAPLVDKLELDPNAAKITLKGDSISKVHNAYKSFKNGTIVLVIAMVVMVALTVLISVHHVKTSRRILTATGVSLLLFALSLQLGSIIKLGGADVTTQEFAKSIALTLTRGLQLTALVLGVVCIVIAVISKLYPKIRAAK